MRAFHAFRSKCVCNRALALDVKSIVGCVRDVLPTSCLVISALGLNPVSVRRDLYTRPLWEHPAQRRLVSHLQLSDIRTTDHEN